MGLDAVEIVMDVEDHFGISIKNAEAEHVRTVGDLVSLIQSRIAAAHLAKCSTLTSFLKIRAVVRELAADDGLRIRTTTSIIDVLSPSQRRRLWKRFDRLLGAAPPGLQRPPAMQRFLVGIVIVAILFAIAIAAGTDFAILPLTLAIAAVFTFVLHVLTVPYRSYPPVTLSTFGALSQRLAGATVATKRLHLETADAILVELRPIVVNTLGVDADEVVPSARFVEDLGMG